MDTRTEQLIESWFANKLSEAEATELRQLLANDPEVATEFAWQQSLAHAVQTNGKLGNDAINDRLRKLERQFRFRQLTLQITAVAAAILTFVVALWFFNQPDDASPAQAVVIKTDSLNVNPQINAPSSSNSSATQSPSSDAVEQERQAAEKELQRQKAEQKRLRALRDSLNLDVVSNFQHFTNNTEFNTAGGVEEGKKMAKNAFVLYDKKEYAQAAAAFEPIVKKDSGNAQYQFFYAVSLLGNKQYADAANVFQALTKQEGDYQTPAKYYLGLALTGAEKYKSARKALQDYLAAPNNRQFKNPAEKMLTKLPPQ